MAHLGVREEDIVERFITGIDWLLHFQRAEWAKIKGGYVGKR